MKPGTAPILVDWQDGVFVPALHSHAQRCNEQFEEGKRYSLIEYKDRSQASHGHYFAALTEAWANLPEEFAVEFPTVEHLRKYALIKAGYFIKEEVVLSTAEDARRVAAFCDNRDDYRICIVNGNVLSRYTAKSQSMKEMGRKPFEASKQAVLVIVADMCGIDLVTLTSNAGKAA
jgi:hypothetical protein